MIWRRKRKPSPDTEHAREQLAEARKGLASARDDDARVDRVAEQMRELRHRNRFGPMISDALRGSK